MGCSPTRRFSLGILPHSLMPHTLPRAPSAPLQVRQHKSWVIQTESEPDPHIAQAGPRTERLSGKSEALVNLRQKVKLTFRVQKQEPPRTSRGGSKSLILSPGMEKGINQPESKREKAPSCLPGQVLHKFRPGCRGSYKEGKWALI